MASLDAAPPLRSAALGHCVRAVPEHTKPPLSGKIRAASGARRGDESTRRARQVQGTRTELRIARVHIGTVCIRLRKGNETMTEPTRDEIALWQRVTSFWTVRPAY